MKNKRRWRGLLSDVFRLGFRFKKTINSLNIFSWHLGLVLVSNISALKCPWSPAEKSHAAKRRNSHSFTHYFCTISSLFLISSWTFMLVYPPLSHVSYFTTQQSPSDLPEHSPSTSTTALTLHLIFSFQSVHFSPSPGTSFHIINLSHLKLNESPAWFLLFFFIPVCSFHNFSLSNWPIPPPDSPHLYQILPALLCGCSTTQREWWGSISCLRGGSVSWRFSGLRAALLAPGSDSWLCSAPGLCRA